MKLLSKLKPIHLIIITAFLNAITWSVTIPIWQYPDEQAHFAQVQNYVEIGRDPDEYNDLSLEVYESERILGTLRDNFGNNQFTYHPSYQIPYNQNFEGMSESYLNSLPFVSRITYVKHESPRYPPLYYLISSIGYRLTYHQSITSRIFATRTISVFLFILVIYFSYRLVLCLFPLQKSLILSSTLAVAFHPMLTFVGSGVNNDILLILISTILIYLLIKDLNKPLVLKDILVISVVFFFGVITKQLIFPLVPAILIVLIYRYFTHPHKLQFSLKLLWLCLLIIPILIFIKSNQGFWLPYWPTVDNFSLTSFLSLFTSRMDRLYRETLPWYWGVYKWLGVVLPLNLIRTIKVVMLLSGIGWLEYVYQKIRSRKILLLDKRLIFIILTNLVYFLILITWDILLELNTGFGHGIQGRYFFPLISTQMAILVFGLYQLLPKFNQPWLLVILTVLILSLNLTAFYTIVSNYFSVSSLEVFVRQLSQYKPDLLKWPYWSVFFIIDLLGLVFITINIAKNRSKWLEK